MVTILYSKSSSMTARGIYLLLKNKIESHYSRKGVVRSKFFIRYGYCGEISPQYPSPIEIFNDKKFVKMCGNKLSTSKFFSEKILTPVFYRLPLIPEKYPVLIRKVLNGYGGEGIIFCRGEEDFLNNISPEYYWTPYIPKEREFRILFWGGKVQRIFEKIPRGSTENMIVCNSHNHDYKRKNIKFYQGIIDFMDIVYGLIKESFHEEIFFGADVGKIGNEFILFELNSAPGMNTISQEMFAEYILNYLGDIW